MDEATAAGFAVILDLHWNAPGAQNAVEQLPGPDLDHAPLFWTQVATAYMSYSNVRTRHGVRLRVELSCSLIDQVIFDLYNEPYEDNNAVNSTAAWKCWRDGCQYTVRICLSLMPHEIALISSGYGQQWPAEL